MKIKIIIFTVLLSMGSSILARCLSCAERAALRKSLKDAVAAQLAAEQVALAKEKQDEENKENKEEQKDKNKKMQCCSFCALMGCDCQGKNPIERAPREPAVPETSPAFPTEPDCGCESIQDQLCFLTEEIEELNMAIE